MREAVAKMYNAHHRQGKPSQYTWENVCIVPGGRAGLIRIAAVLGNAYLGFFVPDYTAYNEMLSLFRNFSAIPIPLERQDFYHIHASKIEVRILSETASGCISVAMSIHEHSAHHAVFRDSVWSSAFVGRPCACHRSHSFPLSR